MKAAAILWRGRHRQRKALIGIAVLLFFLLLWRFSSSPPTPRQEQKVLLRSASPNTDSHLGRENDNDGGSPGRGTTSPASPLTTTIPQLQPHNVGALSSAGQRTDPPREVPSESVPGVGGRIQDSQGEDGDKDMRSSEHHLQQQDVGKSKAVTEIAPLQAAQRDASADLNIVLVAPHISTVNTNEVEGAHFGTAEVASALIQQIRDLEECLLFAPGGKPGITAANLAVVIPQSQLMSTLAVLNQQGLVSPRYSASADTLFVKQKQDALANASWHANALTVVRASFEEMWTHSSSVLIVSLESGVNGRQESSNLNYSGEWMPIIDRYLHGSESVLGSTGFRESAPPLLLKDIGETITSCPLYHQMPRLYQHARSEAGHLHPLFDVAPFNVWNCERPELLPTPRQRVIAGISLTPGHILNKVATVAAATLTKHMPNKGRVESKRVVPDSFPKLASGRLNLRNYGSTLHPHPGFSSYLPFPETWFSMVSIATNSTLAGELSKLFASATTRRDDTHLDKWQCALMSLVHSGHDADEDIRALNGCAAMQLPSWHSILQLVLKQEAQRHDKRRELLTLHLPSDALASWTSYAQFHPLRLLHPRSDRSAESDLKDHSVHAGAKYDGQGGASSSLDPVAFFPKAFLTSGWNAATLPPCKPPLVPDSLHRENEEFILLSSPDFGAGAINCAHDLNSHHDEPPQQQARCISAFLDRIQERRNLGFGSTLTLRLVVPCSMAKKDVRETLKSILSADPGPEGAFVHLEVVLAWRWSHEDGINSGSVKNDVTASAQLHDHAIHAQCSQLERDIFSHFAWDRGSTSIEYLAIPSLKALVEQPYIRSQFLRHLLPSSGTIQRGVGGRDLQQPRSGDSQRQQLQQFMVASSQLQSSCHQKHGSPSLLISAGTTVSPLYERWLDGVLSLISSVSSETSPQLLGATLRSSHKVSGIKHLGIGAAARYDSGRNALMLLPSARERLMDFVSTSSLFDTPAILDAVEWRALTLSPEQREAFVRFVDTKRRHTKAQEPPGADVDATDADDDDDAKHQASSLLDAFSRDAEAHITFSSFPSDPVAVVEEFLKFAMLQRMSVQHSSNHTVPDLGCLVHPDGASMAATVWDARTHLASQSSWVTKRLPTRMQELQLLDDNGNSLRSCPGAADDSEASFAQALECASPAQCVNVVTGARCACAGGSCPTQKAHVDEADTFVASDDPVDWEEPDGMAAKEAAELEIVWDEPAGHEQQAEQQTSDGSHLAETVEGVVHEEDAVAWEVASPGAHEGFAYPYNVLGQPSGDAAVRARVDVEWNDIIFLTTSSGFIDFFFNWRNALDVINQRRIGNGKAPISNYIVLCEDIKCYHIIHSVDPRGVLLSPIAAKSHASAASATEKEQVGDEVSNQLAREQQGFAYKSAMYNEIVTRRPRYLLSLMKLGINILYTDTDTVLLRNPFPFLRTNSADIYIQSDKEDTFFDKWHMLCTGFMYLRNNAHVQSFIADWKQALENMPGKTINQEIFNQVLHTHRRWVSVHVLDDATFPSGALFFNPAWRSATEETPVLVHNNFIVGSNHKRARFQNIGLWQITPEQKQLLEGTPSK